MHEQTTIGDGALFQPMHEAKAAVTLPAIQRNVTVGPQWRDKLIAFVRRAIRLARRPREFQPDAAQVRFQTFFIVHPTCLR